MTPPLDITMRVLLFVLGFSLGVLVRHLWSDDPPRILGAPLRGAKGRFVRKPAHFEKEKHPPHFGEPLDPL